MKKLVSRFRFSKEVFAIVFYGYCFCFLFVEFLVTPLQLLAGLPQTSFASLLYLPHGIRVLSIWLYKEKAVIPLFFVHLFVYVLFGLEGITVVENIGTVLVGTFCAPLAFVLIRWIGFDVSVGNTKIMHWRSILFMGFMASIINSLGNSFILSPHIDPSLHLLTASTYLFGDTMGVFVLLLILLLGFRLTREYRG
jgi:hypothetical protein